VSVTRRLIILAVLALLIAANFWGPLRVRRLFIELRPEPIFHLGRYTVSNTLLSSWLAMIALVVLAYLGSRRLVDRPAARSLQNIVESVFEALYDFLQNFAGDKTRLFFPVVGTLFLYVLASNWIGLLPGFGSVGLWVEEEGERLFYPLLRGASTDLNMTLALAICAVLSLQVYGMRAMGWRRYLLRFVAVKRPVAFVRSVFSGHPQFGLLLGGFLDLFVGLLDIFEELTKVISFAFRLFGNMFGGEVLLAVIAFLMPFVVSVPFLALELFGGFIQALIFSTLTTAFLARATSPHVGEEDAEASQPAASDLAAAQPAAP